MKLKSVKKSFHSGLVWAPQFTNLKNLVDPKPINDCIEGLAANGFFIQWTTRVTRLLHNACYQPKLRSVKRSFRSEIGYEIYSNIVIDQDLNAFWFVRDELKKNDRPYRFWEQRIHDIIRGSIIEEN